MDLIDQIARTLYVQAWADRQEERGRRFAPGTELMDVAPKTPRYAKDQAWRLVGMVEGANNMEINALYAQVLRNSGRKDTPTREFQFGHLLAMQALGHGVGLSDAFMGHGVTVPDFEFMLE